MARQRPWPWRHRAPAGRRWRGRSTRRVCPARPPTCSRRRTTWSASWPRPGVPSTCLGGGAVGWAGRLRQLVHGQGIDVVHVHSPHPAAVARPALRVQGRHRPSILYTEHNSWEGYGPATRWANAATYPFDDARLAVSAPALASIPRPLRRQHRGAGPWGRARRGAIALGGPDRNAAPAGRGR